LVHGHNVAIVVDSSSCLPADLVKAANITVVPHGLIIGDRVLRDGVDITSEEFYRVLRSGESPITTVSPSPQQFLEAFAGAAHQGRDILALTLSSSLSTTYQAARAAAVMDDARLEGARIEVVDTRAAAGSLGLIALATARWAAAGRSLDSILAAVDMLIPKVNLIAFVDTLEYLVKSGRAGRLQAWAGSKLNIKPVMELNLGEPRLLEKPRGRGKATQRLLDILRQRTGGGPAAVNVMHAGAAADARDLCRRVDDEFNCREVFISEFTPVMGAHTGPGLLGLAFHTGYTGPLNEGNPG
jgi:DegV family protein with EDD domain